LTINTLEDEEEREFLHEESPRNTIVDAVSVSASTTTAGPSVNIMERMSAAVRRLESDLVAKKEELTRTLKQRDEAREECVNLMSEVEEKRKFQMQVGDWQRKYDELDNRCTPTPLPFCFGGMRVNLGRYNEALVLLGEKSERVEELQLDIVDLKEGYQHALQRLVEGK
jgi:TATA element modulatory factor